MAVWRGLPALAEDSPESLEFVGLCPTQASPSRRSLFPVGSIDSKLDGLSSLARLLPPLFLESSSLGSREMSPIFLDGTL